MLRVIILAALSLAVAACVPQSGVDRMSVVETAGVASAGVQISLQRAQGGIARPLGYSPALQAAAEAHAGDLAQSGALGHLGTDGSTPRTRAARAGYDACVIAENIARGQPDVASVLSDWMESAEHRANLLDARVMQYGLARQGSVWVLKLARPC